MTLALRVARPADAAGIHRVLSAIIREGDYLMSHEPPTLADYSHHLEGALALGAPVWVAVNDGAVIGWCDLHPRPEAALRDVGRIGVGVALIWRLQGLGRRLMQAVIEQAGLTGFRRIELEVFADNSVAIGLYQTLGFMIEGRHTAVRPAPDGYRDTLSMALLLPEQP
ncbi:GNAT family N-acetyltransferase [Natronospirillum operosum]|uniref:GNAT family N-acetyltransferase n=1 Tax=Natronospirillum operosum TaxID=2759953 RepID=UPI001436BA25|nr:GNAT family N-acetyltransferase [Natronospirillum operosum]